MKESIRWSVLGLSLGLAALPVAGQEHAQAKPMGFFITSVGVGDGGNLGGLQGADAHCQKLAAAVGAGQRTWRAYLSTELPDQRGEMARSRIGAGPWYNSRSERIAADLDELHLNPNLGWRNALTEKGEFVKGRGDKPNEHDILTGTQADGTSYFPDPEDHTCNNWTSNGEGSAQVGHHDRHGGGNTTWNSSHPSRGCGAEDLRRTGGNGYFYCFAAD